MRTDIPQNPELRTQNSEGERKHSPLAPWFLLGGVVLAYYALMNVIYFKENGWLATHGSDIWFFLAFARKMQPLSMLDITYWIVSPIGGLSPEQGFTTLICIAVYLHLLSTLLVYHYLGKLLKLDPTLRFVAALLFAVLPQNTLLSTASFTHFTVAQPILIIAFAQLLPWCLKQAKKPDLLGIICLAEAVVIGPEGWFLLFCLVAIAASKRINFESKLTKIKCPPSVAIIIACITLAIMFPLFYRIWSFFSFHIRGIDLIQQKDIRTGDLVPLGFKALTVFAGFHLVWLATAVYALWKRQFLPAFLLLFFMTLSAMVFRAFYMVELSGFVSLMYLLTRKDLHIELGPFDLSPKAILGTFAVWMLLFGLIQQKASFLPPHLTRVAHAILAQPKKPGIIACSPSYGFFFQAWTGRKTTDDLHHPPGNWADIAAMRPMEANRTMQQEKIAYIILTTWDFRSGVGGNWLSGGLDKTLQPLGDEDYNLSLVVRALTLDPPVVKPLEMIIDATDITTRQRAVCLAPSS